MIGLAEWLILAGWLALLLGACAVVAYVESPIDDDADHPVE